ncbi:MAG: hypothetical protein AVDCRST_MAG76-493, partial [uncultured Acidimicrobiales bacterium]
GRSSGGGGRRAASAGPGHQDRGEAPLRPALGPGLRGGRGRRGPLRRQAGVRRHAPSGIVRSGRPAKRAARDLVVL